MTRRAVVCRNSPALTKSTDDRQQRHRATHQCTHLEYCADHEPQPILNEMAPLMDIAPAMTKSIPADTPTHTGVPGVRRIGKMPSEPRNGVIPQARTSKPRVTTARGENRGFDVHRNIGSPTEKYRS
jgi:hypothetical protein